jgi:N6-adenosine-specific RNA methylase IME4/ParB-like chromosome segregation protein Spo0J
MSENPMQFQLLPSLSEQEYESLKSDIAARGVMVPVEKDEAGNILDGFHRLQICAQLGIEDYPVTIRYFQTDEQKEDYALSINLSRRHLSVEQRKTLVGTLRGRGWTLERISGVLGTGVGTVSRDLDSTFPNGKVEQPESTIGKDGKSRPTKYKPRTITARNKKEAEKATDALDLIGWDDGEIKTTDEVMDEAKRMSSAARIGKQREEIAEKCRNLPEGKYSCIVIDPPWPMQKIEREERPNQIGFDYPTMSYEELLKFPCGDFAADDCHLYLWTTHKHLPFSFELAEAWGFKYQCLMTWVKNVGMTPFSWMYSTEHVLFCKRGNLPLDQLGLRLDFNAKVREHSRKPDEFYDLVKRVSAEPRIDIFSREGRDGFESWGSEAGMFDPATAVA